MYVSRINLDKSLGEDDPHTEMDVLPSKQETAIYTPPPKKKNFYAINLILSMVTYENWDTNNQTVDHHCVKR